MFFIGIFSFIALYQLAKINKEMLDKYGMLYVSYIIYELE